MCVCVYVCMLFMHSTTAGAFRTGPACSLLTFPARFLATPFPGIPAPGGPSGNRGGRGEG